MKVLKNFKVRTNKKGEGFIFLDENNKVYFLDKFDKTNLDLEAGDVVFGWVSKELEKVGYIKLGIDGETLSDFILNISELDLSHFHNFSNKAFLKNSDITRFSNMMYNEDDDFNNYRSKEKESDRTTSTLRAMMNKDINSELDEFLMELAYLYKYLINR